MKKVLIVATVGAFLGFEENDIKILKKMGYKVFIACNVEGSETYLEKFECEIFNVPFARSPFSKNNIKAYKVLKRIMYENQFDLVHCHTPVGGVIARLCANKYRKSGKLKVIYTAHGFHFFKGAPIRNWLLYYPVEWLLSWITDILITINKEDYKRAKKYFHSTKVKYIPGVGVDIDRINNVKVDRESKRKALGVGKEDIVFLLVGELHSRKNQKVVIEAIKRIDNSKICCLIAGKGILRNEYERIIREYGLEKKIQLLGFRDDIIELCKISDCFIHPSIREGLGIAPLEAMACGLPVIGSELNGMRDYIKNGKTGIAIKNPTDVKEMVNAIDKVMSDKEFRLKTGRFNMEVVKRFDILETEKIMKEIYMSIYNR